MFPCSLKTLERLNRIVQDLKPFDISSKIYLTYCLLTFTLYYLFLIHKLQVFMLIPIYFTYCFHGLHFTTQPSLSYLPLVTYTYAIQSC